jgi:hypothetical protein
MDWHAMLVEVEEWRGQIQLHFLPPSSIARAGETVRPRMQERNSGGAAPSRGGFEVAHASQKLDTSVAQRRAEYSPLKSNGSSSVQRRRTISIHSAP